MQVRFNPCLTDFATNLKFYIYNADFVCCLAACREASLLSVPATCTVVKHILRLLFLCRDADAI